MLTADRNEQLDQLLGTSIADFDIPDDVYQRAVDRFEDVGAWLSDYWMASPADGMVYPQGSFRLGTVVQPINPRDEYDVDLVCRRDIARESTTQAALKLDVGKGLSLYVASGPDGTPSRSEGKRCWTLNYPREPFHMDVLPAIPNVDVDGSAIWLTDKDLRMWQPSNPIDYASWFHGRMRQEFIHLREAIAKRMEIADVPDWRVKTTLQRTVQALKRHRDMFFRERPKDRPASIIITTLAARAYSTGGTLYEVLVDVTLRARTSPTAGAGTRGVTCASSNGWSRRRRTSEGTAPSSASTGCWRRSPSPSAKRAGEALGSGLSRAREAGLLGMGAGTGLLGTATLRPVPQHTFHGDPPVRRDA